MSFCALGISDDEEYSPLSQCKAHSIYCQRLQRITLEYMMNRLLSSHSLSHRDTDELRYVRSLKITGTNGTYAQSAQSKLRTGPADDADAGNSSGDSGVANDSALSRKRS